MSLSRLLALLPYCATVLAYYKQYQRVFRSSHETIPTGWVWDLVAPLLVASLTPLALAGKAGLSESHRSWLVAVSAVSILSVVAVGSLMPESKFFRVMAPVGWKEWEVPWLTGARVLMIYGFLVVLSCATVNLLASGR